ncbi:hypothetical protein KCP69_12870 [Salmonella enterica subsp. enterica]|nr:hypothetical protein KCP69_12870 [Salmonella enterica subsp. enterica]
MSFLKRHSEEAHRSQNWSVATCVWIKNVLARRANLARFAFIPVAR